MKNLWNETDINTPDATDLDYRVYSSRLLGKDKSLVLHGGGNTSVKVVEENQFGEKEDILYVKGSGWDLETIEPAGFAPVRLAHLQRLAGLAELSDPDMVNELVTHMTQATAPTPSVEAILHAIIPHKYVDHTHADAVITITNSPDGASAIQAIYGQEVIIIPYVMPGFDLARLCAQALSADMTEHTIGMVLLNHGIFSFGESAKASYERMIYLVDKAETYIRSRNAWQIPATPMTNAEAANTVLADLRRELSNTAGFPVILKRHTDAETMSFVARDDLHTISQQGPATPDHVIRTKRLPMLGTDVNAYVAAYQDYYARNEPLSQAPKTMLDPAPRVVLDPALGLCAVGRTAKEANIVADIYAHTIQVVQRAVMLGGYQALPEHDIFAVEYWDLEQAKLRKAGAPSRFAGEIALVTGAASGIGAACVNALLDQGAAVVGVDINPSVEKLAVRPDYLGLVGDVTSESTLQDILRKTVDAFGGLDMLVLNAGIFPGGCAIAELESAQWRSVMNINLDAGLAWMRECHALLKLAPNGGRIVIIGSKNVPAPGPGAAAYSASKAALNQLARVAALEWGSDNIRVNSVHPNAVFDTAIWTDDVLAARAAHYGVSVEAYKCNNVLRTEISSQQVAEMVIQMCGSAFACTTGAQVPVDGGNDRVI